jgi:hypothetical protein
MIKDLSLCDVSTFSTFISFQMSDPKKESTLWFSCPADGLLCYPRGQSARNGSFFPAHPHFLSDRRSKFPVTVQTAIFILSYKGEARRLTDAMRIISDFHSNASRRADTDKWRGGQLCSKCKVGACRAYGRD